MSFNTTTMEQSEGTPRSGEKASGPGPVRRTWEKMQQPRCVTGQGMLCDAAGGPESPPFDIAHVMTFEHAGAVAVAMVKEVASFLKREEGDEALRNVFVGQAEIIVNMSKRLLVSDEVGQASRLAGEELVLGTSDGLEKRLRAGWKNLPKFVTLFILPFCAVYACFFSTRNFPCWLLTFPIDDRRVDLCHICPLPDRRVCQTCPSLNIPKTMRSFAGVSFTHKFSSLLYSIAKGLIR